MSEPTRPADAPPPLGPVLRHYGPWIGAIVGMLGLGASVFDLRSRVATLEERLAAAPVAADAGQTIAVEPPPSAAPGTIVTSATPPPAWACAGSLTEEQVRSGVGRQGPAVLACIETRVAADPAIHGVLVVRMRVDADGRVSDVHVAGLDDPTLVGCVGNAALGWSFDPPAAGGCAVVEAPFAVGEIPH